MKKNLFKIGAIVSTILPISAIITCSNDKNTKKPSAETNKNKGDKSSSGSDASKTEVKKKGKDNGQNPSVQSTKPSEETNKPSSNPKKVKKEQESSNSSKKPSEETKKNEGDKSSSENKASRPAVEKKNKHKDQKTLEQSTKPSEKNKNKGDKSSSGNDVSKPKVEKKDKDNSQKTSIQSKKPLEETNKPSSNPKEVKKNQESSVPKALTWDQKIRQIRKLDGLANPNKKPIEITKTQVLDFIKNLLTKQELTNNELNKLTLNNIELYDVEDSEGTLSIKIVKDNKEIVNRFKKISGFKKEEIKVSQKDIDATNQYVARLEKIITISKRLKDEEKNKILVYKFVKNGNEIELPIIGENKTKLDPILNEYLLDYGFDKVKIFNVKTSDKDKPIKDFQFQKEDLFRIGYKKKEDNKFYLFNNNKLGYATKQEAIDSFTIKDNLKTYTLQEFLKENLLAIKYKLKLLGRNVDTSDLDNMLKEEESKETSTDTTVSNPSNEKSPFDSLVDKYIIKKSESLYIFEKKADGKFKNENGFSMIEGSNNYKTSFKIDKKYYIIWGLFKKKIRFKNFRKNIFTDVFSKVDSIAVLDIGINEVNQKKIAFVFFKENGKWIFATDYINEKEKEKVQFQNFPTYKNMKTKTHNKFDDLLDYTKSSLAE